MAEPIFLRFDGLERHRGTARRDELRLAGGPETTRCLVGVRGIVGVAFSKRSFLLKRGRVLYLPPNVRSVQVTAGVRTGRWELVELRFAGPRAARYAAYLIERYGHCLPLARPSRAARMLRELSRGVGPDGGALERTAYRWFTEGHRGAEARRDDLGKFLGGSRETLVSTASEHGFSLAAMAVHFSCSPSLLSERLARAWGMPAGVLLKEARWFHARRLMAETSLSLRDIAAQCGYASPAAFNAAFRKRFGVTPGALRARGASTPTRKPLLPAAPAPSPAPEPRPNPSASRTELAAVVPGGPYLHFDGGEVAYPFETPYKLAVNTVSDAIQWVCTLEGEAVFEVGGHRIRVTPGIVLIFPQPINAQWVTPERKPWHRVWLKLRGPWAMETLAAFVARHGWLVTIPLNSAPVALARKWVPHWRRHRDRLSLDGSEAALEWFLVWRDLVESGQVAPRPAPDMRQFASRSFFRRLKTVTAYAREIGYSRSYLSRKLKTQWLETPRPGSFFRRYRLTNAAHELRDTRLPVSEIARRALYTHTSTFIQAFRREFGVTPLQHRLRGAAPAMTR